MKKTVFFLILAFITVTGFAQGLGVNLSYNIANMRMLHGSGLFYSYDFMHKRSIKTIGFGMNYDYQVANNLFVSGGINYSTKGYIITFEGEGENGGDLVATYKLNYLDVPIMVKYNYEIGNDIFLYGKFGPSVGFSLGGSVSSNDNNQYYNYELEFKNGKSQDFRSGDFGFNFGIGVLYNNFDIGMNFYSGLKNLGIENQDNFKHRMFSFSIGYRFDM